jgi:hypothetical protein
MLMEMRSFHCTRAALVAAILMAAGASLSPIGAAGQAPPMARGFAESASTFTVFVRGIAIGSEQSAVTRSAEGWTINASGRIGAPADVVTRRLQVRYDPAWKPIDLTLEATVRGQLQMLHTTVAGDTIRTEITSGTQAPPTTVMVAADVLLATNSFAPYEAVAARLKTAENGSTISGYVALVTPVTIRVTESVAEKIQTAAQLLETRHSRVTITPAGSGAAFDADIWGDANGRLLRLSIPMQALEVVREDVASVAARQVPISRPNDEQVRIPDIGFSLAGTISKPTDAGAARLPGVVFVGGSGPTDRDEQIAGIPILGQLASAVADAGFVTLRYDKRGVGQSGGRIESAGIADLSDDVRAAVKLLSERKDVDPKRIAVVGHSEGGPVVLLAGSKEKRIAAIGVIAANGVSGSDLVLEQQQHALARMTMTDAEKQSKVDLQKRINQAVITGKGWEELPPEARRLSDNSEFQSLLMNDPAKVLPGVRQPLLILQGELDTQVLPVNAERLEALARKRKNAPATEMVKLPGVNHLLVPATTGEVDEYGRLPDKHVSPSVSNALIAWLRKTLTAQ